MVLAIPYVLVGVYFEYFGGKQTYPGTRKMLFGPKATILTLIIVVLYWIGRNLLR